jgi:hypothetical protein
MATSRRSSLYGASREGDRRGRFTIRRFERAALAARFLSPSTRRRTSITSIGRASPPAEEQFADANISDNKKPLISAARVGWNGGA